MSTSAAQASSENPMTMKAIIAPLVAVIIGLFMVILDGTAMNVALSGLMEDFDKTLNFVQWTATGYALAQAAVIPLAGWLSDRFGAKRVFLVSIALFTVGSILCAMATSIEMLIAFRVLQGLGGGMVAPIAMAIIYRLSPPDKVGAVMGMMGIPILLAPALGPVVAGAFIDYASWHWIFIINIPVGIIGILVGARTLPNIERQSVASLDMLGIIFGPLAFAALSYGVSEGGNDWGSVQTITGLIVGGVALLAFIVIELNMRQPLLELRVFRSRDFSKGIIVQWVTQFALFGTFLLIPLFLIQVKGYTAMESGLIMLPQAIASGLFMPIGGRLYDKIGARPLLLVGLTLVSGAGFLLSQISPDDGIIRVMLPLAMMGAGMGLSMMPLNTHLIQSAPQNLVGRVTSLTNAAQQVVTSFAMAGLSTILTTKIDNRMVPNMPPDLSKIYDAYGETFLIVSAIGLAGAVLAIILKKPKKQPSGDGNQPEPQIIIAH